MKTAVQTNRVQETGDAVKNLRAQIAQVEADKAAAADALQALRARIGADALDDPKAGDRALREMQALRDRGYMADEKIKVLRERLSAAKSEYLIAEAEVLEAPIEAARRKLELHNARTDELLKQLAEHEGNYVPEEALIREQWSQRDVVYRDGPRSITLGRSVVMQREIAVMEVGPKILRDLAAGRDPKQPLSDYPACVASPDALVKAPIYLRYNPDA